MKTFKHIALAFTALLLVTSCAIDEMWEGMDTQDEEKVLTFKPKFEDFEAVTKAIGDGSKVDKLLVQVYEENGETPVFSYKYDKEDWNKVQIAFYYGKTYKVYFWAYDSDAPFTAYKYTIINGEIQLNKPIEINYRQNDLAYNTLESLDAFYSVQTVNLSESDKKENTVKLTRPFAQVNLGALAEDFVDAQVSKAVFKVNDIPSVFTLSDSGVNAVENSETITSPSFTFTDFDLDDESKITFDNKDYRYIGTTYILVPSLTDKVTVDVAIYGQDPNSPMKEATVELTVGSNKRTNLIFKEIAPSWNDSLADSSEDVPSTETGGWIHITKPEELAALLIYGGSEGKKYHICANLDMSGMPPTTASQIGLAESGYRNLTIDAGKYNDDNVTGKPVEGGSYRLKNINGLKAFFGIASDLHIQNIILDNVNVSGDTHVGVLVNSLSGENTFTNVTIQNSSAETSSGAAGGMVGYIVRASEKDRAETLSVTIDSCKVNNTSASGTLSEGKFVGLLSGYDNGEQLVFTSSCSTDANTSVTDWSSPYKEGNEGAWLASNDYSSYDGWLGDEVYYRGKVYFGDTDEAINRFCRKWDGTTTVEPLLANASYDAGTTAGTNRFVVYSPFDLAGVRKNTASPAAIYLMNHIDMFGQGDDGVAASPKPNRQSVEISDDNLFNPFEKVSYLDGMNFTIHNLSVEQVHNTDLGGTAFIRMASGETTHQNLTLSNPDIKAYSTDPISDGNAYAGTLVSTVTGKYSASNIQILGGNVFAICKMGGLYGRISGCSSFNISNCIVDGITLRNYDSGYNEVFLDTTLMGIRFLVQFHSDGEVGGLIGFITGSDAVISDCQVKNCNIYCTGENDWEAEAIVAKAQVPGRHVNSFIGDVRTTRGETISISRYTLKNNNLHKSEGYAENKYKEFRRYSWNSKSWECFGFVYAVTVKFDDVPGTVKVDNNSVHVSQSIVTVTDKSIN